MSNALKKYLKSLLVYAAMGPVIGLLWIDLAIVASALYEFLMAPSYDLGIVVTALHAFFVINFFGFFVAYVIGFLPALITGLFAIPSKSAATEYWVATSVGAVVFIIVGVVANAFAFSLLAIVGGLSGFCCAHINRRKIHPITHEDAISSTPQPI